MIAQGIYRGKLYWVLCQEMLYLYDQSNRVSITVLALVTPVEPAHFRPSFQAFRVEHSQVKYLPSAIDYKTSEWSLGTNNAKKEDL